MQELCGFLNFLGRAIIPGRAFTRRLYNCDKVIDKKTGLTITLKQHHHFKLTQEMRLDLESGGCLSTTQVFSRGLSWISHVN